MRSVFVAEDRDDDFFQQGAQEFLWSRRVVVGANQTGLRSRPSASRALRSLEVSATGRCCWRRVSSTGLIERPQALLPFGFETTGHQAIFGIDGAIAAFGLVGFIARPFYGEPPLREGGIVIGFELLRGEESRLHARGSRA